MNQQIAHLKDILELAKTHNLKALKVGDIEVHFGHQTVMQPIDIGVPKEKMPTEEDMLFWSSEPFEEKKEDATNYPNMDAIPQDTL